MESSPKIASEFDQTVFPSSLAARTVRRFGDEWCRVFFAVLLVLLGLIKGYYFDHGFTIMIQGRFASSIH